MDGLQLVLDIAGFIPGIGDALDIVNAGISLARGDYFGAASSLVSAIPGVGSFIGAGAKAVKAVSKTSKAVKAVSKASKAAKVISKVSKAVSKLKNVIKYAEYFYEAFDFAATLYRNKDDAAEFFNLVKEGKFDITNREHVDLLISMGNLSVSTIGFNPKSSGTFEEKKKHGDSDTSDTKKKDTSDSKNKETTQGNKDDSDKQTCKYDPINVVTGSQTLVYTDIEIEDITGSTYFKRTYESIYRNEKGLFGSRWMTVLETNITEKEGLTVVQLPDMSLIQYKKTETGYENVRKEDKAYRLFDTKEGYLLTSSKTRESYYYHRNGQLDSIEDGNHNQTRLIYRGTLLEKVVYSSGQYLEFLYTGEHVSCIRDILGRETKYTYEGEFLTSVTLANGGTIHYDYTPEGYLRSITDQNGHNYVTNYYDRKGRVVRQELSTGDEFVMFYDEAARENTFVTTANGNKVVYAYGKEKLPTKVTYADGTCEIMKYDESHNIIYQKDRNGGETYRTYNENGLLLTETLPTGLETRYTYNDQNLVTQIKDNAGWEESRTYDGCGNVLTRTCRIDRTTLQKTSYTYDTHGRMLTATDPKGNVTTYSYDTGFSFISEMEAPEGIRVSYTYDRAGRNMSVEHEFGSRHYGYNHLNMITLEEDEEGGVTERVYDSLGNVVAMSLPNADRENGGRQTKTRYEYDDLDNLVRTITPAGRIIACFRDVEGNILKEIHPNTYDAATGDGEGIRYEYDFDGNRTKIFYPDGGVERFFYDGNGNLIKRIAPEAYAEQGEEGAGYSYAYDAGNRLICVTNPEGMVEHAYIYDPAGNLIKEMDGKGYAYATENEGRIGTLFTYNNIGWLTEKRVPVQEEAGEIRYCLTTYRYDVNGNCIEEKRYADYQSETSAKGSVHTIRYTYDGADRLIRVSDCTGAVMEYAYDSLNRRTMEKRKLWENLYSEKHYFYSPTGRLIKVMERTDEAGCGKKYAKSTCEYDKNGNPIRIVTPLGNEILRGYNEDDVLLWEEHKEADGAINNRTEFTYDKAGNLIAVTDVNGVSIRYTYDLLNREITTRHKNGGTTWKQYNRDGRLIKEIQPNAYAKHGSKAEGYRYGYDCMGRETSYMAPDGSLIYEKTYNAYGELSGQRDATGGGISYAYDLGGRCILARTEGNSRQTYAYDAMGRVVQTTDGNGNVTTYELDRWGRITGISTAEGIQESYAYDYAGNMIRSTDGEGHTVSYAYNALSLMSERTDAAGETEKFLYDEEGRLKEHTDRNGSRTLHRHNMYAAPTLRENKESGLQEVYGYTRDGKLSYAIGGGMRYDYEYYPDGSLKAKKASGKTLLSYEYDLNGNKTAQTDFTGKRSEYIYNDMNLLTEIRDNGNLAARYRYGADGTIRELVVGEILTTSYEYDFDKNIVGQKTLLKGRAGEKNGNEPTEAGRLLVDNRYGYDGNGNRIFKHTLSGHTSYAYDGANRLAEVTYPNYKETFHYDRAGNRTERITESMKELYSYDACNRLIEQKTIETGIDGSARKGTRTHFGYDKQGNLLFANRERCGYRQSDSADRNAGIGTDIKAVANVQNIQNANVTGKVEEQATARFYYDAFNRQIKTETFNGQIQLNRYDAEGLRHEMEENGQLVQFLYSGREVIAETTSDASVIRYIRGYDLISSDSESARTYYHYVNDENGSITHVLGEEDADEPPQVLNHYEYDAFGNYTVCEERVKNRFGYTGQQYDAVTGQYYLRARFYNPVIGRFNQEDTYYGDGLNLYAYCGNLPVGYADPSGNYRTICDKKAKQLEDKKKNGELTPKEKRQLERYYKNKEKQNNAKRKEVQRKKWEEYTGKKPTGEVHHGLPEQFKEWFESKGIKDINSGEFYYDLPKDIHRLKSGNGIHTNSNPLRKNWNAVWEDFIENNKNATKAEILDQLKYMEEMTGIGKYKAKKKKG